MPQSLPETRASLILRLQNADDVVAWDEFAELYGPVVFRAARRRGLQGAEFKQSSIARSSRRWTMLALRRCDTAHLYVAFLRNQKVLANGHQNDYIVNLRSV